MLLDQVDEHVPLPAVRHRPVEQKRHLAIADLAIGRGNDRLEEVVRPLQLVPEHQVVLGEFEFLDAQSLAGVEAQQVQAREHPAATGLALIGDRPVVEQGRERVVGGKDDLVVERDLVHVVASHGVLRDAIARRRQKLSLGCVHAVGGESASRVAVERC